MTQSITIESLGARGDGIGRLPDDRRVFVPYALPGEIVSVELGDKRDDGIAAEIQSITTVSPNRIVAPCIHFGVCGGCVAQHMNEATYRDFKMDQVRTALSRAGVVAESIDGPHVSAPGTRRRATFAAFRGPDKLVLGFNEARSTTIVDLVECWVLTPRLVALIPDLRTVVGKVLTSGQGMDISVIDVDGAVDMVLRPWTKKKTNTQLPMFILERLCAFADAHDIARLTWQNSAGDEEDLTPVAWRKPFSVDFSGTTVTPPPAGFLQATKDGEVALVKAVLDSLPKKSRVADLYAGSGTFTFAMAAQKHKVHAVEGFAPAYIALKTAMPGRPVTAEKRDLARDPVMTKELKDYDVVVLDPPRIGALEQVKMIARSEVRQVTYVSCSPASFARDAAILCDTGFELGRLSVIDQFLWSPHIELVGVFVRNQK